VPLPDSETLSRILSAKLDEELVRELLREYVSQEKRYILRDWEPATLDGGQFVEAAARIVYHVDSGNLNRRKPVSECLGYIEDQSVTSHKFPDRKSALHICKVLRTIYKFRSDRGAVHIDPVYTANQLDSRLVIDASRWILSELLRLFWSGTPQQIAQMIREILRYEIPAIDRYGDQTIVQRIDCTAEEEILLLLREAGESGLTRDILGKSVRKTPGRITQAVQALERKREIVRASGTHYCLTDLGARRVLTNLGEKMILG